MKRIPSDEELLRDYIANGCSASACAPVWDVSPSQARERVRELLQRIEAGSIRGAAVHEDGKRPEITDPVDPLMINRIMELVQAANVSPNAFRRIKSVKLKAWGVAAYDRDSKQIVKDGLYATTISVDPNFDKEFPLIQPATPTVIKFEAPPRILRKLRTEVVISDMQIGFVALGDLPDVTMEPMHDLAAIDVAMQITRDVRPKRLINIGDAVDWSMFSRWPKHPEMRGCTQKAVDQAYIILGEFRSAAGKQLEQYVMIGSNHQSRPEVMLRDMNLDAMGMRRACDPKGWPVFSEPFMCRYDDLGITFSGQYPGGPLWILDDLVAMHAPPKRLEFQASVLHGHTHKLDKTPAVAHGRFGRQEYFIFDSGCLCETGSPEDVRRYMQTIVPSNQARTNWNQGIAVVEILEGKVTRHQVTLIHIKDGVALYGGQTYNASTKKRKAA